MSVPGPDQIWHEWDCSSGYIQFLGPYALREFTEFVLYMNNVMKIPDLHLLMDLKVDRGTHYIHIFKPEI